MKIIEVRDGFIIIEADEGVYLSSFVKVKGIDKNYVAQINRMQSFKNVTVATAKILFVMRGEELFNYDKTEPSKDAEIIPFTLDILRNSIKINKPVIIGKTMDNSGNIVIDSSSFNKKMLMSIDNTKVNHILLPNLTKQFSNIGLKTVIIDTNNSVKIEKSVACKDFKLPLNRLTMQYLYKACLNEATPDSKPIIADVFKDLLEYAESVEFVSFDVLKSIVDDMVDKQHIFKLFVLKNKLSFFKRMGYFADKQEDAEKIKTILKSDNPVIDISITDSNIQNCCLEYVYSLLEAEKTQVLLEVSNAVSKKNLKMIITESDIPTSIIVNSRYTYLNDIKALFDNFIIEPSVVNKAVFKVYSSFLGSMKEGEYLIAGEGINYIPVISKAQVIDETISFLKEEPVEIQETAEMLTKPQTDEFYEEENVAVENNEITESETETAMEAEETENETETESAMKTDSEDGEEQDIAEDVPEDTADLLSQEDIIANIDQRSEDVINSVADNLKEIENVDLFDDSDKQEDEEFVEELTEEEGIKTADEVEEDVEGEVLIEPEYAEIKEGDTASEELVEEEPINELPLELENDVLEINDSVEDVLSTDETVEVSLAEDNNIIEETSDDLQEIIEPEKEIVLDDSYEEQVDEESLVGSDMAVETLDESIVADEINLSSLDNVSESVDELPMQELLEQEDSDDNGLTLDELASGDTASITELEEFSELNPDESDENDIIIDISDEDENINIDEELDKQIVDDVDKVYTTMRETEDAEEISDSDLDLIDELNSDGEEALIEEYDGSLEEGILEQPTKSIIPEKQHPEPNNSEILEKRDSNTPIVPVYDADIPQEDLVVSDPIQQGDSVVHAKYGNGIVEKMIKYGTKTLFSINFENIGRRLLDPTLTEIKKL